MNKKLNSFVGVIVTIVIFLALIIPSIAIYYSKPFPDIVLLTTSKVLYDHGFSESSHDACLEFSDKYDTTYNYIFPNHFDLQGYIEVMITALENGTDTIVTTYNDTLHNAVDVVAPMYPDKNFIVIDDANYIDYIDNPNVNVLTFQSSQASFVAGIMSSIYVVTHWDNPEDWNVGGWGGLQISSVIGLLSGFEQGINWFNYYFFGTDIYGNPVNQQDASDAGAPQSLMADPGKHVNLIDYHGDTVDYSQPAKSSAQNFYSGSFELTGGVDLATGLVLNDAKVVIPIAGAQTADALDIVSSNYDAQNNPIQVVGMDTDAKLAYPDFEEQILFSVLKNVELATYCNLWQIDYDKGNIDEQESDYEGQDVNPFDFSKSIDEPGGWNVSQDIDPNSNGKLYQGTYENQGVGISDSDENSKLYASWVELFDNQNYADALIAGGYNESHDSFEEFINYSFASQLSSDPYNPIESFSYTFTINNKNQFAIPQTPTTIGTPGVGLWIPDWDGKYNPNI